MKSGNHLPMFGVGPLYVVVIIAATALGIVFASLGLLGGGAIGEVRIPFAVVGVLLIVAGIVLWCAAVLVAKVDDCITRNQLVTSGVYAWVRNPIYTAFLFFCTGAILLANNLWLLVLPPVFWFYMTALMRATEEKWLLAQYGDEYVAYCKRVNRCIPWMPRKR